MESKEASAKRDKERPEDNWYKQREQEAEERRRQ